MNTFVVILVVIAFSYSPGEAQKCSDNPPPCTGGVQKLIICLDTTDYGSTYACLCENPADPDNPVATLAGDCDLSEPLTSMAPPTIAPSNCQNGGVFVSGTCRCPSGYSGTSCETFNPDDVCKGIQCKNNGACAKRVISGIMQPVCQCRGGFSGSYCEITGTAGACAPNFCQNNGQCREQAIGTARYAYCDCQLGFSGTKCDKKYFTCKDNGQFEDSEFGDQGYYFQCVKSSAGFRIIRVTCPNGLRFKEAEKSCA